jgi:hypothetical protein
VDSTRRLVIASYVVGLSGLLGGCVTRALFGDKKYNESVSAVLISQDGKHLVVVTPEYHYIFDAPSVILLTVNSPLHRFISADLYGFRVQNTGQITGRFMLDVNKDAPDETQNEAIGIGYKRYGTRINYVGHIRGMRYRASNIQSGLSSKKLNQTYNIEISEEQSQGEKALKVPLSPITVAVDGAYLIGVVYLMPVFMLAWMAQCAKGCK